MLVLYTFKEVNWWQLYLTFLALNINPRSLDSYMSWHREALWAASALPSVMLSAISTPPSICLESGPLGTGSFLENIQTQRVHTGIATL